MKLNKIGAVLAFIIGAAAIFAGLRVGFLGRDPGYDVIAWLPIHNLVIGVVTVFITAVFIWKNSKYALTAVVATLAMHLLTMGVLLIGFGDTVAKQSLVATGIRIVVWLVVLGLMLVQRSKMVKRV